MKSVLCLSSIAVILFSGLYLYRERFTPQWRAHQLAYLDQVYSKQTSNAAQKSDAFTFDVGLKQVWLPQMNRADRCIACHVAMEDPHFEKEPNPLKAHPQDYLEKHDPQKHGCTICHDGQGRAVNLKDAHANAPAVFWGKPLLKKPFIEANCYRCHVDPIDQTPAYNQGREKFETSGCLGCHKRDGLGGFVGPEFRGIGDASARIKYPLKSFDPKMLSQLNANRNLAYIYEAVRFPGAQPEETAMFDFKLSDAETRALTVYLKSLGAYQPGVQRLTPRPASPAAITEKGQKTFELYCTACHGNSGRGGVRNPNYIKDYIPKLNTLSEQMFLYKKPKQDAVISILDEFGDLLEAGPQPDIPGFFKVVAKYMPVKHTILDGRIVERKNPEGPAPLNMPAWKESLTAEELSAVIAYLISVY